MDDLEIIWHKYNLRSNPYFTEPLKIEGSIIPIEEGLVGREKEKKLIMSNFSLGGGTRFLVLGDAGVGKTSLVNYTRAKARENLFFTPVEEIKVIDDWTPTKLGVDVLQNLYLEVKSQKLKLSNERMLQALEDLFELSRIMEAEDINPEAVLSVNLTQVTRLYNELVSEIIKAGGYKAVIIHFNNLDNIDQMKNYDRLFNNLRDFFQNPQTILIFLGFELLSNLINSRQKVRQIFNNVPVIVGKLSDNEIVELIEARLSLVSIKNRKSISPHSPDSIRILYGLYDGNARDILNSLSASVMYSSTKSSLLIDETKLKQILHNLASEKFINQVSPNEKEVLLEILKRDKITNSELAVILKKQRQHMSKYLQRLTQINAIKLEMIEGTKKYYTPTAEALWLKLTVTDNEIKKEKNKTKKKIEETQKSLKKFFFNKQGSIQSFPAPEPRA